MSFGPVYVKGVKRTPYLGEYIPEAKEQANWELLLYRSLLRDGFSGQTPAFMLQAYSLANHGAQFGSFHKLESNIPALFVRMDSSPFSGLEALWLASKQLESFSSFFLLGGGNDFDQRSRWKLSEDICREELLDRETLDKYAHQQINKFVKASARGTFASQIMSILYGKNFPKLISNDFSLNSTLDLTDLMRLPTLIDRIRGVVTQGNSASVASAFVGVALSSDESNAFLAIDEIKFIPRQSGGNWKDFVQHSLQCWEQSRNTKISSYSSVEFVEVAAAHGIILTKLLSSEFSVELEKINSLGGALGRGFCPSIESWVILTNYFNLMPKQKGLMIVPHPEGHLGLMEVRKI